MKSGPIPNKLEYLWDYVSNYGDPDKCWEWQKSKHDTGYGAFTCGCKSYLAHRVAYELTNGPISRKLFVAHSCGNRICCNPNHMFLKTSSLEKNTPEDIWKKVSNYGVKDKCWEWQQAKDEKGYGLFRIDGKMRRVHRIAYELVRGTIPEGLLVCHTCDNPSCCNPDHLWLGTNRDNLLDCVAKGRIAKGDKVGAKLTESQIKEIRKLHKLGVKYKDIMKQFSIVSTTVWCITSGKSWPHISLE